MVPARVALNGVQVGWPIGDRGGPNECDQVAAFGEDGDLRGVSKLISNYFSLGFFGDAGDWIEFRYYSGAQNQTYYSNVRYSFEANPAAVMHLDLLTPALN